MGGALPDWAAPAFADSSPGLKVPYGLALRRLRLPPPSGGSDAFTVW